MFIAKFMATHSQQFGPKTRIWGVSYGIEQQAARIGIPKPW